jgi:hypothetical protein
MENEIEDEPKVVEVCSRTVVLHGNERARTYFLRREEFIAWAMRHPSRGRDSVRRNVTARPTTRANKGFGSRY